MAETAVATQAPAVGEVLRRRPYIPVFATLAVVTGLELAITTPGYFPVLEHTFRIVLLVIMSTIKASLVVAYYMHLRYEPRWLALIPLAGLALVAVLVAALTATVAH
jgi:caa(3)-type oxidase subunit IV